MSFQADSNNAFLFERSYAPNAIVANGTLSERQTMYVTAGLIIRFRYEKRLCVKLI